jgi:hypothetical protein
LRLAGLGHLYELVEVAGLDHLHKGREAMASASPGVIKSPASAASTAVRVSASSGCRKDSRATAGTHAVFAVSAENY